MRRRHRAPEVAAPPPPPEFSFPRLDRERARMLRSAIGNTVLEGWQPSVEAFERLSALGEGIISVESFTESAIARARATAPQSRALARVDIDAETAAGTHATGDFDAVSAVHDHPADPEFFTETVYPGTRILRNKVGIVDPRALDELEFELGAARAYSLEAGLTDIPETFDGAHVDAIHGYLFGPLYRWAGHRRRYDMALGHSGFYADQIDRYLHDASKLMHRRLPHGMLRRRGPGLDRLHFARLAAEVYAYLNCAHPYREGNGRANKVLLQLFAHHVGYHLRYDLVSKSQWDNASRLSGPENDCYRPAAEYLYPVFTAITAQLTDELVTQ